MLIDYAKIYVSGGDGGKGCQSLHKDLFNRKGTPDGGDGGDGGNVIIESSPNLQTLLDFRFNQHHQAGRGKHGGANKKAGRSGVDKILLVPAGTVVKDIETGLVLKDLVEAGERVVVARGGDGGKGNAKLREATPGEPGEELTLILELKLVADAGIIGFPNAGKSTLVSKISKAHSKIASYPFTTKQPKLGVVKVYEDSFVAADMPGLIEGAHAGRGLGDRFLRHIERTRVLVHVVDMAPFDGTDPVEIYNNLEKELKLYSNEVFSKPRIIVASKMDMPDAGQNLDIFIKAVGKDVLPISALTGDGLSRMVQEIYRVIKNDEEKDQENSDQDRDKSPY